MSVDKKRIAKNAIALYARMALVLIVSLYTSRVVLSQLGASDFGIYNVVGGVLSMLNFMTAALSQGIQRFFNFHKGRNDIDSINKVFWSALIVMGVVSLIIVGLAETIGLWFLNTQMNIPDDRMNAANWVFQFAILSTMVSLFVSPYNAMIVSHEDFNIYAYLSIGQTLLILGMTFLLAVSPIDKLVFYASLMFSIQLIYALTLVTINKARYKQIRPQPHKEKDVYKSLLSFSGWNVLGVGMFVLGTQGVNIILNLFFGTIVNAARGIAVQISAKVDEFINNIQQATNPQIVQTYASGDYDSVQSLMYDNFRWNFSLYWLIALPLMFEIDYILNIWLVEVPEYTGIFTIIIVLRSLLKCIERPINSVNFAIGKMKPLNIFATGSVLLTTALMVLLFWIGFPPYWAFIIDCLSISFCISYYSFHAWKYHVFSYRQFLSKIALPILAIITVSAAITFGLRMLFPITGFLQLIYTCVITTVASSLLIFFILFTPSNRAKIVSFVNKKILKK